MFDELIFEYSSAKYEDKILLIDRDHLLENPDTLQIFRRNGFTVIQYKDDLDFRIHYEHDAKNSGNKIVVVGKHDQYIPYDIRKILRRCDISYESLFPRLNADVLREYPNLNLDYLVTAYRSSYDIAHSPLQTEQFLRVLVYTSQNIDVSIEKSYKELMLAAEKANTYQEWFRVAEDKAKIDVLTAKHNLSYDTSGINILFRDYILKEYGKLSGSVDSESPVLVSRAMDYMHDRSKRFVIIVMDGMSEFDWHILSDAFHDIHYRKSSAFAMIPTVTSVSRQCLLSNKFPKQLLSPWNQSKEKQEFVECAKSLGYTDAQIAYDRGYDVEFAPSIRCAAIIINEIDDMVHGEKQGRSGMLDSISLMKKQGKLGEMIRRYIKAGFDVYISADHGNTPRKGMGKLLGTGLWTETKSHCMLVLKDFADKEGLKQKYQLIDFPKTYLPAEYDYLICDVGDSFDVKDEVVMTHGGISIDEGIVPFIQIKAVYNNG